jgi:hypothetical protein
MEQRAFSPWSHRGQVRPRLLIEDPDRALQLSDFRLFDEGGFDVALCCGPGPCEPCSLVEEGRCQLAAEADVVLIGPGMAPERAELAAAHHRTRPELPVVVAVRSDAGEVPPAGCAPLTVPSSVDGQIRAVWRALAPPAVRPAPASPDTPPPDTPPPSAAESATMARLVDLLGW